MCTGSNTVPVDCGKSRNRNGDRASSDKVLWAEENNYINYGEEDQMNNYEGHIISHFVKDVKLISIHDLSSDSTKDKDRISGLDIQALVQLQSNLRSKKLKAFLFDGSRKAREFPKINSLRNLDRYVFLKLHVIWHSESIMVSTKIRISVFHQAGRNYETG
nr:PREDICTED: uncharacterized protein LOC109039017 isoform X4 [Bemisia tabaci]